MSFKENDIREMYTIINITFRHCQIKIKTFSYFFRVEVGFRSQKSRFRRALPRTNSFGNKVWLSLSINEHSKLLTYIRFDMICAVQGENTIDLSFRLCNRIFSLGNTIQKGHVFSSGYLKTTRIKLEQKTLSEFGIC